MARYSHDVIVLGAGAAGLTAAAGCAQLGLRTALVEKDRLGGDCLYHGCVPSKALLKSARVWRQAGAAPDFGLPGLERPPVDLAGTLRHVRSVIAAIEPHDSPERFRGLGAEVYLESPELRSPHEVRLAGGRTVSARTIILATGSSPKAVPIPGLEQAGYITNVEVFSLSRLPASLLTIGAGPIGVELGQAFQRLGSQVTILDAAPQILPVEDADMAAVVQQGMEAEGARFHLGVAITGVARVAGGKRVTFRDASGAERMVEAEEILLAVGRRGNTDELHPQAAGVEVEGGFFRVDAGLATTQRNILAVGDCNGRLLFTHVAGAEGALAVQRTVLRLPVRMSYRSVPWVTYTDPELASVGLNEKRAREAGTGCSVVSAPLSQTDRGRTEAESEGRIKILLDRRGRVVGTQIVGLHAGELLGPAILAVRRRSPLRELVAPMLPYPTLLEVYKKAGGSYFAPRLYNGRVRGLLRFLFRYRGPGPQPGAH